MANREMKKRVLGAMFYAITLAVMFCVQECVVYAAVNNYSASGEYIMDDYETSEFAEARALDNARQNAREQAGVYIKSYTNSVEGQVSEDKFVYLTGTLLKVTSQNIRKETTQDGKQRIIAEITADVDTSNIDKALKQEEKDRWQIMFMYANLQRAIEQDRQTLDAKKREIAEARARNQSDTELVKESRAQERIFLSNKKLEESYTVIMAKEIRPLIDEAIRLNPKNERAYAARAWNDADRAELVEAVSDSNKALAIRSDCVDAYLSLGYAYSRFREYSAALEAYNNVISIDPKNANAYSGRGEIYYGMRDYRKALDDYNRAVALDAENPDKRILARRYGDRAEAYAAVKDYVNAISDYTRAIRDSKNAFMLWSYYAGRQEAYKAIKDYKSALEDCNRLLEIYEYIDVYIYRYDIYILTKDYDAAIGECNKCLAYMNKHGDTKSAKNEVDAYLKRGKAYYYKSAYDKAIADYNRALAINPNHAEAYNKRGNAYYRKGQWRQAAADYEQALRLAPGNKTYRDNLANARSKMNGR